MKIDFEKVIKILKENGKMPSTQLGYEYCNIDIRPQPEIETIRVKDFCSTLSRFVGTSNRKSYTQL